MPETATPDPRDLKELEDEWRRNPRTPSFYSLASRLFEMGRTQDAHDVLLRGLEVHRSHLDAQKLLAQVLAALDGVRGSRPGEQPLGRVRVKSGVRIVEERVSRKIAERHIVSDAPSKVSRHRPPAENPFASDPSDEFGQPAATPWPRLTPESLEIARVKAGGATTLAPRRRMLIAAIVLLVLGAAVAALLIFQPL